MTRMLLLLFLILAETESPAASATVPTWLVLEMGQRAYVTDDGGDATTVTVCETARGVQRHLASSVATGTWPKLRSCFEHKRGLAVVIRSVEAIMVGGVKRAAVEVKGSTFAGWMADYSLSPIIPAGTRLVCKGAELWPRQHSSFKSGANTGSRVTFQVLEHLPYSGDADLDVRVLNGTLAGHTGFATPVGCFVDGTKIEPLFLRAPWES